MRYFCPLAQLFPQWPEWPKSPFPILRYSIRLLLKTFLILTLLTGLFLVVFVNYYSYSSLTRIVYSLEWLLVYTPLIQNGQLVIPPVISHLFQQLHALKIAARQASDTLFYGEDDYPHFAGKYHWSRSELSACKVDDYEMLNDQAARDPALRCHLAQPLPLMFVKVELLNVNPPIVKFHEFLPHDKVNDFVLQTSRLYLSPSKILVKDSLDQDIWQDSLVVNGSFLNQHRIASVRNTFYYMQDRISAFNLMFAEQFHIKKYGPGGHYAPHLDYLIFNPEPQQGNRIATLMVILKPAEVGGGTLFPNAGINFHPKVGDAILWLNMNPDYSVTQGSFHGACPVLGGMKLGATMWIRSVGQELRIPCPLDPAAPFDYRHLTQPKWRRHTYWTYMPCPKGFRGRVCPARAKRYYYS